MLKKLYSLIFPPPLTPEELAQVEQQVEDLIKNNNVVVFSKTYCPYCSSAKALLESQNIEFTVVELNRETNGSAMQDYLEKRSGQRTVPNIFIKQQHLGGCDDLKAADKDGRLQKMLAA
ncbi:hypothetical protein LRAMOSA11455 [Lichtheimia ramosa]|uniref:Glutaredoxin domain-containing protein n=1 Tax=Lichtheimia ramosa TaxID=688394 RepID=A0A077WW03_9FUNG|nr:hypothetical protein LRAMOSA11455 [Lichtheimia ramosa]